MTRVTRGLQRDDCETAQGAAFTVPGPHRDNSDAILNQFHCYTRPLYCGKGCAVTLSIHCQYYTDSGHKHLHDDGLTKRLKPQA